jgi:pimeloyl-ACP methyl ester carboxylesterase
MPRSRATVPAQPAAAGGIRERLLAGAPVGERRLTLAGQPTAVLEGGDGPPVVLLHGAGEFAACWLQVIPALVRTHRVIAPDLPGHGASGSPTRRWTARP